MVMFLLEVVKDECLWAKEEESCRILPEPGPGRVKQCIDNGAGVLRFPTWGSRQAGANGLSQGIEHCLALKNTKHFFHTIISWFILKGLNMCRIVFTSWKSVASSSVNADQSVWLLSSVTRTLWSGVRGTLGTLSPPGPWWPFWHKWHKIQSQI